MAGDEVDQACAGFGMFKCAEAARMLGCHYTVVQRLARDEEIHTARILGRTYYDGVDIDRLMRERGRGSITAWIESESKMSAGDRAPAVEVRHRPVRAKSLVRG
jgi:hypothetical protein